MCGVCACVREGCVVVLEQILQLYPVERQSKKKSKSQHLPYPTYLTIPKLSVTAHGPTRLHGLL